MDTRDFSAATIEEIYDIIKELKDQGTLFDSIHDFWFNGEPDAMTLCTYAAQGDMEAYYRRYADSMDLTKKKFERIVENVREVDWEYQKKFQEINGKLKGFQETLKNLTQEISLRTLSLDTGQYSQAVKILEGEDADQKNRLKELIGVVPGNTEESSINRKIQELLKYSNGNGGLEDEIDVESKEAAISQKKKLLTEVESLKKQFHKGKITRDEIITKLCKFYGVEEYGSKINYSLAVKKYLPEKKAAIVSDILSTVMYIMEEDGIDAEKIEEISQSVKAKSYIDDEMWDMAQKAFLGAVAGANVAIGGKYYAGAAGEIEGGTASDEVFNFTGKTNQHMDNPARTVPVQTLKDAISTGTALPDPQGTAAKMYYTTMTKNGKMYNLEVLYDDVTNTIMHFKYTSEAIGPLPIIPK